MEAVDEYKNAHKRMIQQANSSKTKDDVKDSGVSYPCLFGHD